MAFKVLTNLEIAELLRNVAAAYQLKDEKGNRFRIIAYERAADAVEHASSELKDLWDDGKLDDIPGIGKSIATHLGELFRTGKSKHFEAVTKGFPPAMFELTRVPGIGPKTAYRLVNELKLASSRRVLTELERAAREGKIAGIESFGEQSQADIIKSIEETKGRTKRQLLPYATKLAEEITAWMKQSPDVERCDPLGSLRRQASTVGDVDIAVATKNPSGVLNHFASYPKAVRVLEKGDRTASIILPSEVQVDLMVQDPTSYGALLQHFTGSKHHNIALREYALKLSPSLSLSEYGIKRKGKLLKYAAEEAFYKALGMEWIPPELREDAGEIEAALKNNLPKLVKHSDIKSDLQIHSNFDVEPSHDLGESSFEDIIEKAGELEYEYIAFTEHNPSRSKHSEEQIIDLLKRKKEAIEKLNYSIVKEGGRLRETSASQVKKVFNSLEIDILPDGNLTVPEEALNLLDFALVAIHSSFKLSRADMTKRVLKAMDHNKVKIFAHPTARLLNEREGVELDWPRIFEFCLSHDKWLEINADPKRLDLPDRLVHEAVSSGVKLTLGTDSHHKDSLDNMYYAVSVARRGWATKKDIINTLTLNEFEKVIA